VSRGVRGKALAKDLWATPKERLQRFVVNAIRPRAHRYAPRPRFLRLGVRWGQVKGHNQGTSQLFGMKSVDQGQESLRGAMQVIGDEY
jgi:hypothetical protein